MPTFWQELVGGTVGGAIGITAVYPLDTIKSRLQTSGKATYSGTIHVLTSMARTEGVRHQAQQPCTIALQNILRKLRSAARSP